MTPDVPPPTSDVLAFVEYCRATPITAKMVDPCFDALAHSLDLTDGIVFTLYGGAGLVVLLGYFAIRLGFKVSRLQGEFDAYRSGSK